MDKWNQTYKLLEKTLHRKPTIGEVIDKILENTFSPVVVDDSERNINIIVWETL